jgi:hypothetical protein
MSIKRLLDMNEIYNNNKKQTLNIEEEEVGIIDVPCVSVTMNENFCGQVDEVNEHA